ncbi:hypothetical protein L9F63_024755, partial [Diploptera punctata]
ALHSCIRREIRLLRYFIFSTPDIRLILSVVPCTYASLTDDLCFVVEGCVSSIVFVVFFKYISAEFITMVAFPLSSVRVDFLSMPQACCLMIVSTGIRDGVTAKLNPLAKAEITAGSRFWLDMFNSTRRQHSLIMACGILPKRVLNHTYFREMKMKAATATSLLILGPCFEPRSLQKRTFIKRYNSNAPIISGLLHSPWLWALTIKVLSENSDWICTPYLKRENGLSINHLNQTSQCYVISTCRIQELSNEKLARDAFVHMSTNFLRNERAKR